MHERFLGDFQVCHIEFVNQAQVMGGKSDGSVMIAFKFDVDDLPKAIPVEEALHIYERLKLFFSEYNESGT